MASIFYGIISVGGAGLVFFTYRYIRRAGWKCESNGEKTCVADNISQFYAAEDQYKDNLEI